MILNERMSILFALTRFNTEVFTGNLPNHDLLALNDLNIPNTTNPPEGRSNAFMTGATETVVGKGNGVTNMNGGPTYLMNEKFVHGVHPVKAMHVIAHFEFGRGIHRNLSLQLI
jgi:hypothetical protein